MLHLVLWTKSVHKHFKVSTVQHSYWGQRTASPDAKLSAHLLLLISVASCHWLVLYKCIVNHVYKLSVWYYNGVIAYRDMVTRRSSSREIPLNSFDLCSNRPRAYTYGRDDIERTHDVIPGFQQVTTHLNYWMNVAVYCRVAANGNGTKPLSTRMSAK